MWSNCLLDLGMNFLVGNMVFVRDVQNLISMACILLWSSAVRVHDSQAYRNMDVTRECISCILELRLILLSFQTGFSLVNAAVVCGILKSISGLEPSSVLSEPRYLKLVTALSFYPFILISMLMPLVLFVISLVLSALISMPQAVEALSRHSTDFASPSSSPAKPSMSSAKQRLVTVQPSMLTCVRDLLRHLS